MRTSLRRRILRLLPKIGLEVTDVGPGSVLVSRRKLPLDKALFHYMTAEHVADILRRYGVNCVFDVGAHKGQYASMLRQAGYQGHIVSFEPVPQAYEALRSRAAKDPKWTVYNHALGKENGTTTLNVVYGSMSSVLPPSSYGTQRYKRFKNSTEHEVEIRRLDEILDSLLPDLPAGTEPRPYLKLDTQGYDLEVFAGLGDRVHEFVGMQSEVACLQIYSDMPRLTQAIETYEAQGFEISGMFPVTWEDQTRRVLEFDCVLVRADAQ